MAIYELRDDCLAPLPDTTFSAALVSERGDLQRLLRDQIEIVAPGCLVLTEEFGDWDESARRIDLLALDRDGTLVVVELKRTEDGGHMELQAIRYAAMVSSMNFEQAVEAHRRYLARRGREEDAREALEAHLEEGGAERFGADVRIVLVSAEFSKELTTSVIWLSDKGIDVRCVRLRPYRLGERLLLDIQQVLPLPEAADYQVRVREKLQQEKIARESTKDYTRYDVVIDGEVFPNLNKRTAARQAFVAICRRGGSSEALTSILNKPGMFIDVEGDVGEEEFLTAARSRFTAERVRRSWTDDLDLIHQGGRTYAVTKMWGGDIEGAVKQAVQALGTTGVECRRAEKQEGDDGPG